MEARTLAAAAAMCLMLTPASAQDALPSAALQMDLPSASLPMRLPSAVLPQRTPDMPLRRPPRDVFRAAPQTFAPAFDEPLGFDPRFPCCGAFVGGPFFFPGVFPGFVTEFRPVTPSWARSPIQHAPSVEWLGYLRLLVESDTAQVYVDRFYVGTVADLRRLVTLEAGPHRIELRADGYEAVAFDVRIVPGETITYRADLRPSPAEKPAPPAPGTPKTFYVIPNCYAGDRPPEPSALPRTCDVAKLRTIPPVIK